MAQNLNTSTTKATKAVTFVELWLVIIKTAIIPGRIVLECQWDDYDAEDGPRYWKFLDRIGYTKADLEEWIAANMQERTHTMPGDCRRQRGSVAFRLLQGLMAVLLVFAASTLLWWGYDHLDGWPWVGCLTVSVTLMLTAIGIGTDSLETPDPRHEAKRGKEPGQ